MNVIDFLLNGVLFTDAFTAEMNALNPALMPRMMSGGVTAGFILLDFVIGVLIVLTYAAIRPRFGPGPGTAIKAGLLVWAVGTANWAFTSVMGLFSWGFFAMGLGGALVNALIAAYVGARLYKED